MTLIKLSSNEYFQMSIIVKISGLRGRSRVTTLSILAKASSFSSRSLAVFRSRFTGTFQVSIWKLRRTTFKCISVIFQAIEHLLVAWNEREKQAGTGTAAATVGKRHRWLRYQLLGMRNGEAIEFPETKGAAGRDATRGFVSRSSFNCLESPVDGRIRT